MTVYVLEIGSYSQRGVVGVFATPEAAMAGYPYGPWVEGEPFQGRRNWHCAHGDSADVEEYEVQGA